MMARSRHRQLLVAAILIAGTFTPMIVLGQTVSPLQTQAQLQTVIVAAEGSRAYAEDVVTLASMHGLAVSSAQASLHLGDVLLASAKTDAQTGSNISSGIESATAAMRDYTYAATSASVVLSDSGISTYADYSLAEGAILDVNATVKFVSSVAASACASTSGSASVSTALAKTCADISGHISAAGTELKLAGAVIAQSTGQTGAGVDFPLVLSHVDAARADINATESELATVAGLGYTLRGQAYFNQVIGPLSAQANHTISAEESANSTFFTIRGEFTNYARTEASSTDALLSNESRLALDITRVDTASVTTSFAAAVSVAAQVKSNMSALLALPGIIALPGVVADINSAITSEGSYTQVLVTAKTDWSDRYQQTSLTNFSSYLAGMGGEETSLGVSGSSYVAATQKVVTDLSSYLTVPGVMSLYGKISALQISSSVDGASGAFSGEVAAMGVVESDYGSLVASLTAQAYILLGPSLVESASSATADASVFLNATGSIAMAEVASSMQNTSLDAATLVAAANSSTTAAVGSFQSSEVAVQTAGLALNSRVTGSLRAVLSAFAYLDGDLRWRISEAAMGKADAYQALDLFAKSNIPQGIEVMGRASLELQASSALGS